MEPSVTAGQNRWLLAMASVLLVSFGVLIGRLVELQVFRHEELLQKAMQQTQVAFFREPRRGDIRDVKGNLLAISRPVKTICADPTLICNTNVGNRQIEVANAIAPILQIDPQEILRKIQIRLVQNPKKELVPDCYVVLKRKVCLEEWEAIQNRMKNLPLGIDEKKLKRKLRETYANLRNKAIFAEEDYLREYPNKSLASHVLGLVQEQERVSNRGRTLEMIGIDGIEMTYDKDLRGVPGWRQTERDRSRQELAAYRDQDVPPRMGLNVVLTIDLGIQHIVETELADAMEQLKPLSASALVIRPSTGEILAMANAPTFDPSDAGRFPVDSRRNRLITDLHEPGSTFKIVVVSGALNEGVVTLNDPFYCENGRFLYAGHYLTDHGSYGTLSVEGIITKSSNIGAAKIGMKLGPEKLLAYIKTFGFGQRTGISLPGERLGTVHPLTNWTKLSISRIPMGHEVDVSPLQMTMAMGALANQGHLMRPMIVHHLEDPQGAMTVRYSPQVVRSVCSEETARLMVKALKTVVGTNGTAPKARLEHYTVAGKTGTAKKSEKGYYIPGKYFSSFIGFFPADNPEVCIGVFLDEPPKNNYYGGNIGGPIFKKIAERTAAYMGIRPEFLNGEPAGQPIATGRTAAMAR